MSRAVRRKDARDRGAYAAKTVLNPCSTTGPPAVSTTRDR